MRLTVKEMETLCIFHNGTRAATTELLRHAAQKENNTARAQDLTCLADKLENSPAEEPVMLIFN